MSKAGQQTQLSRHLFANYLEVGHNLAEFVLAFGTYNGEGRGPEIALLVHTSPRYARAFHEVLGAALQEYESNLPAEE